MNNLSESINSNILRDIINNKQNISFFNQFQDESSTYKRCNDLMNKLKSLYKLLLPSHMRSYNRLSFSVIYQEIKPYNINELDKSRDEIVLYINNINKTVYQLNMQLNKIINASIDPYILLQHFITNNTLYNIKDYFNLDLIQDKDFEKYTYKEAAKDKQIYQKIKDALLVFYFRDNNKILGVSSRNSFISKYSYYNNDKYFDNIKNIDKNDHIITLCTIYNMPVLGLNINILTNLNGICNNSFYNSATIKRYDNGVKNGIVLNSTLNKKNRLYTELYWGENPTDYCYICNPPEKLLYTKNLHNKRQERYEGTDTKNRYKWKQDEFGNFKRYVPVINKYNAHLEELKDISNVDIDQYNTEIYKNNQKILKNKQKELKIQNQIRANKIERNKLIDKVQECNNKFLEYLNKNQNNDEEHFNFELHNKVQKIAQDIYKLQKVLNIYINTISNFLIYKDNDYNYNKRTVEQCKSAKDDVETQITQVLNLINEGAQ